MEVLYIHSEEIHNTKSAELIVPLIMNLIPVSSVLDIGCGTGTWLIVFQQHNVSDILGLDGAYVDQAKLKIEKKYFKEYDLRDPIDLKRKFDIVLCLEVAEHLPEHDAETLVESLCLHADNIIFSAAIPGQNGQNHVNEQWPSYWEKLFNSKHYVREDLIRPKIWTDKRIDIWYRQNIFLYRKKPRASQQAIEKHLFAEIHPEFWLEKVKHIDLLKEEIYSFNKGGAGIKRSFKALISSLINKISYFL